MVSAAQRGGLVSLVILVLDLAPELIAVCG